jgi:hypothetical protein
MISVTGLLIEADDQRGRIHGDGRHGSCRTAVMTLVIARGDDRDRGREAPHGCAEFHLN